MHKFDHEMSLSDEMVLLRYQNDAGHDFDQMSPFPKTFEAHER